jgi:hypothetical protein
MACSGGFASSGGSNLRASATRSDGRLEIQVRSQPWFLAENLPIEIRDSNQELVESLPGHRRSVALAPGLYSVSAVLEDGAVHRRHVHIRPGETERVELAADLRAAAKSLRGIVLRSGGRGAEADDVALELFDGAREVSRQAGRWVFAAGDDLTAVPFARLTTSTERFDVSLPVNPQGGYPENSCEVQARMGRHGLRVRVRLAPERTVASTLERMVESGHMGHSATVAKEAIGLLLDKHRDPVGAAFGGLLLHRLGRLEARPQWLENLACSFPWLPDGRVLLAALLAGSEDPEERRRGLGLLLEAAPRRMMFADGLALALDLLRRWPGGERSEERRRVLDEVSPVAARTQWSATVLTVKTQIPYA